MSKSLPPQDHLLRLFSYDPQTGELHWRVSRAGLPVGNMGGYVNPKGYWIVSIDGRQYLAHRIIWKLMTGCEPKAFIDHKDGDKENNRWRNLREATKADNSQNCKKYDTNTSSVKGVTWERRLQKWKAVINANNNRHYIGLFENFSDAAHARELAAEQLHGAFARRE
jgi:hypothetical protein